jgi:lambda repressor-like predicted transcriptional regulator
MTPMQQEWLYRVARFEQSGLSLKEFAAQEGVSSTRLSFRRSHN